jgi:hypothetical protein
MSIRLRYAVSIFALCAFSQMPRGMAASETAPLPGLDTCVNAALQQRPGLLFGWRMINDPPQPVYKVSVMSEDGKIAEADCSPAATGNLHFENRFGVRRYDRYKQVAVPEATARNTAALVFAGNVKIRSMEIDTNAVGHLSYEYRMELPSGHKAMSHVDTASGFLTYAEVKE